MYSFEANAGRRKHVRTIRLLTVFIILLLVLLIGTILVLTRSRSVASNLTDILIPRAASEVSDAQTSVYRLTQGGGNNIPLLANIRSHIYSLQVLNQVAQNVYGPSTVIVDPSLITECLALLDQTELRLQSGNVLTQQFIELRDKIDVFVAAFANL